MKYKKIITFFLASIFIINFFISSTYIYADELYSKEYIISQEEEFAMNEYMGSGIEDYKYKELVELTSPKTIIEYFNTEYKNQKQELFYVVYLDNQKKYLAKKLLFKGTTNYSLVHPREIFKEAYLLSASYIICLHNHPSGNAMPSKNDIDITKQISQKGKIHGIFLLDHIIIGDNNYYSFYEDNNL